MNSKTISFWAILIIGVITVSVASWFIGNSVADYVIKNRKQQKTEAVEKAKEAKKPENIQARADNIVIDESAGDNTVTVMPDADDRAQTRPAHEEATDEPSEDAIPSADSVSEEQPAETAADVSDDELFGSSETTEHAAGDDEDLFAGDSSQETPSAGDKKTLYRVQIGAFSNRDNAVAYAEEAAEKTGLNAAPIKDSAANMYRVQCGAFSSKESAEKLTRELELQGYQVLMSEVEISE